MFEPDRYCVDISKQIQQVRPAWPRVERNFLDARLAAAWARFIASTGWLRVVENSGATAVAGHWRDLVTGRIDPTQGLALSI